MTLPQLIVRTVTVPPTSGQPVSVERAAEARDIAAWLRANPRHAWDIVQGNDMKVLGPWIEVQNEEASWFERNPLGEYDTVLAIAHTRDDCSATDARLQAKGWILA
jgi:hypothetical protein